MNEPTAVDGGLQAERTILAWWRTALAAAVAGLLVVREALEPTGGAAFVVLAATITAVLLGAAVLRVTELQRTGPRPAPARRPTAVFAAAALTLQLLAVILVLR